MHSTNKPSRRGAQLKHRDNFYLYLTRCTEEIIRDIIEVSTRKPDLSYVK